MLGGVCFAFLGVMVPLLTEHKTNWQSEHETVPIEVTLLAFVLLICGLGLVAFEMAAGGAEYSWRKKQEKEVIT